MRPDERSICGPTGCLSGHDNPCYHIAKVAMVLGAVADAQQCGRGVTWAQLVDWIPDMTSDQITETLIECLENNAVDARPYSDDHSMWTTVMTGRGWLLLADLVRDNPTALCWSVVMPNTFGACAGLTNGGASASW